MKFLLANRNPAVIFCQTQSSAGPRLVGFLGYGPARFLTPDQVKQISERLASVSEEHFRTSARSFAPVTRRQRTSIVSCLRVFRISISKRQNPHVPQYFFRSRRAAEQIDRVDGRGLTQKLAPHLGLAPPSEDFRIYKVQQLFRPMT